MNGTRMISIPESIRERLAARIERNSEPCANGCVLWTGSLDRYGYARFPVKMNGARIDTTGHRIAWMLENGKIDDPKNVIDHLCRNRACVNPAHMEIVSAKENTQRGALIIANRERLGAAPNYPRSTSERCANGHERATNGYVRIGRDGYSRTNCRACDLDRARRFKERHRNG